MNGNLNGLNGVSPTRRGNTIFIPLPQESWRPCGPCSCDHCGGKDAFWDTLAVAEKHNKRDGNDHTWMVHAPELQPK